MLLCLSNGLSNDYVPCLLNVIMHYVCLRIIGRY